MMFDFDLEVMDQEGTFYMLPLWGEQMYILQMENTKTDTFLIAPALWQGITITFLFL